MKNQKNIRPPTHSAKNSVCSLTFTADNHQDKSNKEQVLKLSSRCVFLFHHIGGQIQLKQYRHQTKQNSNKRVLTAADVYDDDARGGGGG